MPPSYIVRGQLVSQEKVRLAKDLRQNMTEAERVFWQRLRADRLEGRHFRRQQVIAGFIVDFYCHSASLIIEVDGEIHKGQIEADNERDQGLQELGFQVLRFENRTVLNELPNVLQQISKACQDPPALNTISPPLQEEGSGEYVLTGDTSRRLNTISPPLLGEGPGERSLGRGHEINT